MLSDFPSPWYIFIICEWDVKMKVSCHIFKAIIEPSIILPAQTTEERMFSSSLSFPRAVLTLCQLVDSYKLFEKGDFFFFLKETMGMYLESFFFTVRSIRTKAIHISVKAG